jgi:hypothetical protein
MHTTSPSCFLSLALDHIYSHLVKHVTVGFNFMGSGLDTKATGIILTPYCMNIIQLCLDGMGTSEADNRHLRNRFPRLVPLMSKNN